MQGSKKSQLASAGVPPRLASDAERIAANPEIVEKIISDAKERGDIPTKGAVKTRSLVKYALFYRQASPSYAIAYECTLYKAIGERASLYR